MRFALLAAFLLAGCAAQTSAPERAGAPAVPVAAQAIPLNPADPAQQRIGALRYLGGVHLTSADPRFGSLSALRWKDGRLHAIIDEGGWATFAPVERGGRLTGVRDAAIGKLHGPDGAPLEEKVLRDAEGLTRDGDGWLVSFERNHRVWAYRDLGAPATETRIDLAATFGEMGNNEGVEAIAGDRDRFFACAERLAAAGPNCAIVERGAVTRISLTAPPELDPKVAFPVDADFGSDGTLYVLFRSWSGGMDSRGGIVARSPDGRMRTLGTLVQPLSTDNYEGLAVREQGGRTYLYVISDDNFDLRDNPTKDGPHQRTLLLKFEVTG
ncbi:MAG: esterase-like activity of phytase family protein [Allosphingosinicella sp.]